MARSLLWGCPASEDSLEAKGGNVQDREPSPEEMAKLKGKMEEIKEKTLKMIHDRFKAEEVLVSRNGLVVSQAELKRHGSTGRNG